MNHRLSGGMVAEQSDEFEAVEMLLATIMKREMQEEIREP